jgi:prepilin-type N-terminal cleavage/methylation domain-containing protein
MVASPLRRGFTLIEVAIVGAILSILIVSIIFVVQTQAERAGSESQQFVDQMAENIDAADGYAIDCPPGWTAGGEGDPVCVPPVDRQQTGSKRQAFGAGACLSAVVTHRLAVNRWRERPALHRHRGRAPTTDPEEP